MARQKDKWGRAQEDAYFKRREELMKQGMSKLEAHEKAMAEVEGALLPVGKKRAKDALTEKEQKELRNLRVRFNRTRAEQMRLAELERKQAAHEYGADGWDTEKECRENIKRADRKITQGILSEGRTYAKRALQEAESLHHTGLKARAEELLKRADAREKELKERGKDKRARATDAEAVRNIKKYRAQGLDYICSRFGYDADFVQRVAGYDANGMGPGAAPSRGSSSSDPERWCSACQTTTSGKTCQMCGGKTRPKVKDAAKGHPIEIKPVGEGGLKKELRRDPGNTEARHALREKERGQDAHIGWKALVKKLMKEGKSKEYAEKIAGKINAEKYGKDAEPHKYSPMPGSSKLCNHCLERKNHPNHKVSSKAEDSIEPVGEDYNSNASERAMFATYADREKKAKRKAAAKKAARTRKRNAKKRG